MGPILRKENEMRHFDVRILPGAGFLLLGGLLLLAKLDFLRAAGDGTIWSYAWMLVPGLIGVGMSLAGLFKDDMRQARSGIKLMVIGAVLFIVLAALLGKLSLLGAYGPAILLVILGVWLLTQALHGGTNTVNER
jgi:hypothetical protein